MMNKQEAEERIAAIEREAAKLREIIARADGLKYDKHKMYVGIDHDGSPSIMVGREESKYFRFHYFKNTISEHGWDAPQETAQGCLDSHARELKQVWAFSDVREGFSFFLDHYRG